MAPVRDLYPPAIMVKVEKIEEKESRQNSPYKKNRRGRIVLDWRRQLDYIVPPMDEKKKKREKNIFREYFELIAETAVFVFFVMTFVVQAFQIPTGSMEPTLLVGDFLLVNKMVYSRPVYGLERVLIPRRSIRRQDIVVFKFPQDLSRDFVKRVIALEGEKLEIKDKQVYINDQPLAEPYKVHNDHNVYTKENYYHYDDLIRDNFGPVVVPRGHLFVMGDNRDNSLDSRFWSFLPLSYVKGRPWIIYFSRRHLNRIFKIIH